jgi:hypothetical protein
MTEQPANRGGVYWKVARLQATAAVLLGLGALAGALASCTGDCLAPPCPMPIAITINVTDAATGGPVTGAFVSVTTATTETIPCTPGCIVLGDAETYRLQVEAPGFETAQRAVTVRGSPPSACSCGTAISELVDIALVRTHQARATRAIGPAAATVPGFLGRRLEMAAMRSSSPPSASRRDQCSDRETEA